MVCAAPPLIRDRPRDDLLLQGQFSRRCKLEYSGLPADAALVGTIDRDAFPASPIDQPMTTNDIRMGQATLRHAFSDRLKLTVSGRYYSSVVDEQGSFVYLPAQALPTDDSALVDKPDRVEVSS